MTSRAAFGNPNVLDSGGSIVANPKLKGIDGRVQVAYFTVKVWRKKCQNAIEFLMELFFIYSYNIPLIFYLF